MRVFFLRKFFFFLMSFGVCKIIVIEFLTSFKKKDLKNFNHKARS